jgi:hypothetical protein
MTAECGAHLRGGRRAEGLTAAAAGEAAWFGGAKRVRQNARGEPRPIAGATQEQRLLGVGSTAWLGDIRINSGSRQDMLANQQGPSSN